MQLHPFKQSSQVLVTQSCLTLCGPMDYSLPGSSVRGILQTRILEWVAVIQGIFPTQGPNPGLPHCRWSLYKRNHKGSPRKNTRVGILFLLQWIFLIQESVRGLLHCRQILYQLSYQGSPELIRKFILKMVYIKKTKLKGTAPGNRGPWLLRGGSL